MTPENFESATYRSAFIRHAQQNGCPIAMISGGVVTWSEAVPTPAVLQVISLAAKRAETQQTALNQIILLGKVLVRKYPEIEQRGWPQKLVEALGVVDESTPEDDARLLQIEASLTGESVSDLAAETISAAQITSLVPVVVAGLRRRLEQRVSAAATIEELETLAADERQICQDIKLAFAANDASTIQQAIADLV